MSLPMTPSRSQTMSEDPATGKHKFKQLNWTELNFTNKDKIFLPNLKENSVLSHLLSRLFHAGGHRCMSRCEAFLCSVYKNETDYWKLLMLNIVMQLFKHSFTPCPLVSAQSPLQRTAAFWCPQRQGRNTTASSFWGFQAGRKIF